MSIESMTGYGRASGSVDSLSWQWEIKSVNGRHLDLRCRLPNGFDDLEPEVRAHLNKAFRRGHFTAQLQVDLASLSDEVSINETVLERYLSHIDGLRKKLALPEPRAELILDLKGVVELKRHEQTPEEVEARKKALLATLSDAVQALKTARREEGMRLGELLRGHLARLSELQQAAIGKAADQPEQRLARLRQQIAALLADGLSEDRLHQEAALLASKVDVTEELDRLTGHIHAVEELMKKGGSIGRKLDFLLQELNREANTLCAKSQDVALTHIGVEIKGVIDQCKEQVQNIE